MTRRQRRLILLPGFILALIGLLDLAGCTSPAAHQQTQAIGRPVATSPLTVLTPPKASTTPVPTAVPTMPPPTRPSTQRVTEVPTPTDMAATEMPTPTIAEDTPPAPNLSPTPFPWLLAYNSDAEGNDEIYLLPAAGGPAINATNHAAEDRYPSWSPDGKRIAFQSDRDGNWEIYTLDVLEKQVNRLTFHLAYDGAPSWSPDGRWIVFESYRDTTTCQLATPVPDPPACPDLEIYRVPAEGGTPQRLTFSPGGDYEPTWSPDGLWIAFTSWREGDREIFVIAANGGQARNVTANDADDWAPAWSPDGGVLVFLSERGGSVELYRQARDGSPAVRLTTNDLPEERPTWWLDGSLLFARYDPGPSFEAYDPYYPGEYDLYRMSVDSDVPQPLLPMVNARNPAAAPVAALPTSTTFGLGGKADAQRYATDYPPKLELKRLDEIEAPDPRLVAGVDEAFRAWRTAVKDQSGHDFLGRVSDIYRPAAYYNHRLGYLSWHKAGRAVDLLFDWLDAEGKNALYVVREDLAGEVYWRLYLKCAVQDGSLGEPLTQAPWYFWWHPNPTKEPETFANGGRELPIPAGYFVDVTALAERYGWSRIASYHLDDFHWKRDSTATEYWHYQHTDGLNWYQAMSQIHSQELLEELFSRALADVRGQTEAVMDGKGLPPANSP